MKRAKFTSALFLIPTLLVAVLGWRTALADDHDSATGLTDADRTVMAEGAQKYRRCLRKEAAKVKDKYSDVRQVAGVAMKKCAPILDTLETELKARKDFSPELAAGFVHYSSNSGARQLLKQLIEERAAGEAARP